MPIIHLMRHGHVYNPEDILYGRLPNFHLSTTGEQMARVTAAYVKEHRPDVARIVSSPLLRAQQTAAIMSATLGPVVETDERLIEASNAFEGEPLRPACRFLMPNRWWRLRNPFRPSWGEPYTEQRDRMMAAVLDAAQKEPVHETVLVSHQLPIWVTRLASEGKSFAHIPSSRECRLASLTSLTVTDGAVVKVEYSEPAAGVKVPKK